MKRCQLLALDKFPIVLSVALTLLLAPSAWAAAREKVLYRFNGGKDGAFPSSNMVLDLSGDLYGTASRGGHTKQCTGSVSGCGVVFELKPSGSGKWRESVLYAFRGGTDGLQPSGNLVFDVAGNIYGTTFGGGGTGTVCTAIPGCGTVFQLSPEGDGSWKETILYSFQDGADGALPVGLTIDASGNLYGTTITGVRSSEQFSSCRHREKRATPGSKRLCTHSRLSKYKQIQVLFSMPRGTCTAVGFSFIPATRVVASCSNSSERAKAGRRRTSMPSRAAATEVNPWPGLFLTARGIYTEPGQRAETTGVSRLS